MPSDLPSINYIWIGSPSKFSASIRAGHDFLGPLKMAQQLDKQKTTSVSINPIYFWCLDAHKAYYHSLFQQQNTSIVVNSIEEYLAQQERTELHDLVAFTRRYLNRPGDGNARDNTPSKVIFSLLLLTAQRGYLFDTNVIPVKDKTVFLPDRGEMMTAMSPEGFNDFYIMYSPARGDKKALAVFNNWKKDPGLGKLKAFDDLQIEIVPHEQMIAQSGIQKTSYRSYEDYNQFRGSVGLYDYTQNNNPDLEEFKMLLPLMNINQTSRCPFSCALINEVYFIVATEKPEPSNIDAILGDAKEAYVIYPLSNQLYYLNSELKQCVMFYNQLEQSNLPQLSDLQTSIKLDDKTAQCFISDAAGYYNHFDEPCHTHLINVKNGTVLHDAIIQNNINVVKILLAHDVRTDLKAKYKLKPERKVIELTAIELAVYLKRDEIVLLLKSAPNNAITCTHRFKFEVKSLTEKSESTFGAFTLS